MHNIDLILTLTGALTAALVLGYLTNLVGLSPIVGYLLAGIVIGPHTPGFNADLGIAEQLAEIGVILLLFGVGLHFDIGELLAVRRIALPGAVGQSLVASVLGLGVAMAFGWDARAGVVFGLALSVASTVVLTRILSDNRDLHTTTGHIAVGWLVVEDIFTVMVLLILPVIFAPEERGIGDLLWAVALTCIKLVALMICASVIGKRVVPKILERASDSGSRELFTLTVLVLALGIAVGSATVFGVSMALGAFVAGMVVGRTDFSLRAATEALPMRDAFAVLFFVSVGMLLDPAHLLKSPVMIAAALGIVIVAKPMTALVIALALKYPPKVALGIAIVLGQIGEFSFILAALGKKLGVLPPGATDTLVAASIVSITLNPLLYRCHDTFEKWAARNWRLWRWLDRRSRGAVGDTPAATEADPAHRAVIIGYGPVGQTVARLLRENEIEPTVVEMNLETVRKLREGGVRAVYGDASHRDTLVSAGVADAGSLILSSAGMSGSHEVIRFAREMNPHIRLLARTAYVREQNELRQAGVESVFSGEGEVALAMTVQLLRELGATAEQVDRERDRVQSELAVGVRPSKSASSEGAIDGSVEVRERIS